MDSVNYASKKPKCNAMLVDKLPEKVKIKDVKEEKETETGHLSGGTNGQPKQINSNIYDPFTDLLNTESPAYEENSHFDDTTIPFQSPMVAVPHKSYRTKNFSRDEDTYIVSAWLTTSKDPIPGNEKTSSRYWRRIYNRFIINGGEKGRSERSVKHRWVQIKKQCAKLAGYVEQIETSHQPGQKAHDRLKEAKKLFISDGGKHFQLDHCFDLLQRERKWHDLLTTTKQTNGSFADIDGASISPKNHCEPSTNHNQPLDREAFRRNEEVVEDGNVTEAGHLNSGTSGQPKQINSDIDDHFTDLLSSESPAYEEDYHFNDTIPFQSLVVEVPHKAHRTKNFSQDEDTYIVSAWLNTSKDPIPGNEQTSSRYWRRIYDQFIMNGGEKGRTEQSVKHRWIQIRKQCAKLVGCMEQIDASHQSSQTAHDRLKEAKQLFVSDGGKHFQLDHCFNLLQHEQKWHDLLTKTKQTNDSFADVDGAAISPKHQSEPSTNHDRPLDRESSKEQPKKKKAYLEGKGSSTMSIIDRRWEEKIALERERLAQRERLIAVQERAVVADEERMRIDNRRYEMEVMSKDTNVMDHIHAAYWNGLKNEILRKKGLI